MSVKLCVHCETFPAIVAAPEDGGVPGSICERCVDTVQNRFNCEPHVPECPCWMQAMVQAVDA